MAERIGTIVELDPIDALGWIELDDGERVRFGGTSLKGFQPPPGVGTRVVVVDTQPGYRGVVRATEVRPLVPPVTEIAPPPPPRSDLEPWPDFVRRHPLWSDAAELVVPCARSVAAPALLPHPLFAAWIDGIERAASTVVPLAVPTWQTPAPFDPAPADDFAHGRIAFLDDDRWPSCGQCATPLEMCLQISPATLADFVPGGLGLVAMYCFHCGISEPGGSVAHVRLVAPRTRVECPANAPPTASSGWFEASQRVVAGAPYGLHPSATFYRYRSERAPGFAASALLGFDQPALTGPFPDGADAEMLEELGDEFDDWLERSLPRTGRAWGGARLGGVPNWDQADATPSCPHGEMLHLLEYNGGQFLDGALHVFQCRARSCELGVVAEF